MSIESAKAFIERMKTDRDFAGKVAACANVQTRMELVKAAGFEFTVEEVAGMKQDLSDDELGRVEGGNRGYADAGISSHDLVLGLSAGASHTGRGGTFFRERLLTH